MIKPLVRAAAVAAALALMASPAPAKNQPGTKYFYGKGDAKGSDITFAVSDGKVRKALAGTGKVKCSPEGGTKIFKAWGGAILNGHAFKRKLDERGARFVFAGKVYGADANGRMAARIVDSEGNVCDSGTVRWQAHRVSHEEWKKHRHGYSVKPPE